MRMPKSTNELNGFLSEENSDKAAVIKKTGYDCIYRVFLFGERINQQNQSKFEILKVLCGEDDPNLLSTTVDAAFKITNRCINKKLIKLYLHDVCEMTYGDRATVGAQIAFLICDLTQETSIEAIINLKKKIDSDNKFRLTTVLLCTNSNAYEEGKVKNEDELNQFISEHKITAWFKADTQDAAGKEKIHDALTYAVKHCHLNTNLRTMHGLLHMSGHFNVMHFFADNSGAALLFLSIFLNPKKTPLKNIWSLIFSHLLKINLPRKTCELLAVDLAKSRLAYCFLKTLHKENNKDERVRLVNAGLGANDINTFRKAILFTKNEERHEMIDAWKSYVGEENQENKSICTLQ